MFRESWDKPVKLPRQEKNGNSTVSRETFSAGLQNSGDLAGPKLDNMAKVVDVVLSDPCFGRLFDDPPGFAPAGFNKFGGRHADSGLPAAVALSFDGSILGFGPRRRNGRVFGEPKDWVVS